MPSKSNGRWEGWIAECEATCCRPDEERKTTMSERAEVWVHDEWPSDDEVRVFYEIPDRVAQMVRTATGVEGEAFASCLHNLVLEREGAVAEVKRLTRALKEGRSGR